MTSWIYLCNRDDCLRLMLSRLPCIDHSMKPVLVASYDNHNTPDELTRTIADTAHPNFSPSDMLMLPVKTMIAAGLIRLGFAHDDRQNIERTVLKDPRRTAALCKLLLPLRFPDMLYTDDDLVVNGNLHELCIPPFITSRYGLGRMRDGRRSVTILDVMNSAFESDFTCDEYNEVVTDAAVFRLKLDDRVEDWARPLRQLLCNPEFREQVLDSDTNIQYNYVSRFVTFWWMKHRLTRSHMTSRAQYQVLPRVPPENGKRVIPTRLPLILHYNQRDKGLVTRWLWENLPDA